ncbi:MAG TPA: DUF4150 domain-containing protein [Polyangia bacterium]|nr:DUF4150 domain-containing protein [Polyangia bacterium]
MTAAAAPDDHPLAVGDTVFVNKRSVVHAGSAGQSTAFPDVCLCPPTPPAGPIPTPLPNLAMAADLQGGATSVVVEGNPMGKKSSFFAKSTGNEVAQATGGGVVSHIVQGKAYFTSYSIDVTVEGEETPRHLDMMTQNHLAPSPPNAAVGTYLAMMDPGAMPPAEEEPEEREEEDHLVEVFVDQLDGKPAGGVDAVLLVSADQEYDKELPLSAATPKGGLLSLKFEKVLPHKFYSMYWIVGGERIPFFEDVPFARIRAHAPGTERAPMASEEEETSDTAAAADRPRYWDAEAGTEGDGAAEEHVPVDPLPEDHPEDWYPGRFRPPT